MESMKSSDLALSGLTKTYGQVVAVDNVTLRIKTGQLVAFLGPSGCGKTTTLRMIAGLVEPSEGDIYIDGRPITRVPAHQRNIGMLFQSYALFPHLTIAENVAFGLTMRRLPKAEVTRKVSAALSLVQLTHLQDRYPAALSGGQQQRVALARAFVIEPSLLLLDEPLSALDKNLREDMQMEIRAIQRKVGLTAVLVTHDQEEAMTMADQIVVMRAGQIEQAGTPAEIYQKPASRFVASFIGASNFLEGKVRRSENGWSLVETSSGSQLQVAGAHAAGEKCLVSLRPEAVELLPYQTSDVANTLSGTIDHIVYRGQTTMVHLRQDNGELFQVYMANKTGITLPSQGERVTASWQSSSNHIIANA